ncbi:hypothetical protein CSUI_002923 [Cystoisospora suis]|uniref:Uncharacterized protein n=1 Tax=Cystoisospora suis TaxID=483139 RepID=A0A2C6L6U3_9APIC|nr:hypothetical protein CSUI_002923 [Cystoisospora suis]
MCSPRRICFTDQDAGAKKRENARKNGGYRGTDAPAGQEASLLADRNTYRTTPGLHTLNSMSP